MKIKDSCPLPVGAPSAAVLREQDGQEGDYVRCSIDATVEDFADASKTCHAKNGDGSSTLMVDTYDCIDDGSKLGGGICCPNRGLNFFNFIKFLRKKEKKRFNLFFLFKKIELIFQKFAKFSSKILICAGKILIRTFFFIFLTSLKIF